MANESPWAIGLVTQDDIVRARQAGREIARREGLSIADQTRFATAISELSRNVILYAWTGQCEIAVLREDWNVTLTAVVSDSGPGIPDIDRAMSPGFSTGNGLGAGLPGVRRLMDAFAIDSGTDGTRVEISLTRRVPR